MKMMRELARRISQLRESRELTQSQLARRSRGVTRSYIWCVEKGRHTPSIAVLEKLSDSLGIGLQRFFVPGSDDELLLENPFIDASRPLLHQLNSEQRAHLLKVLRAISQPEPGSCGRSVKEK